MAAAVVRVMVMLSGGGRTFQNLAAAAARGEVPMRVVGVVASRECGGAEAARRMGVPVEVVPGEVPAEGLERLAGRWGAGWVVLAGYLRKVHIPASLAGRVVNIHPALLPGFGGPGMYGSRVHEAVLAAGEAESGCTVHLCDGEYDRGAVLRQERVPVLPGDTAATLAARVFEAECRAYPAALRDLFSRAEG